MKQAPNAIEALTAAYAAAVLAKDPDRLADLYDPDVRVFDAWERWSYDGLAAWRTTLDAWLGSLGDESVHVRFKEVRISIASDLGFLSAIVIYTAVDRGGSSLRSLEERLTWVLGQKDDRWTIAHQHTSVPTSFADHKSILPRNS